MLTFTIYFYLFYLVPYYDIISLICIQEEAYGDVGDLFWC